MQIQSPAAEGRWEGPSQACPRVELFDLKCYPLLPFYGHVAAEKSRCLLHSKVGVDPPPWELSQGGSLGTPGAPQWKERPKGSPGLQ